MRTTHALVPVLACLLVTGCQDKPTEHTAKTHAPIESPPPAPPPPPPPAAAAPTPTATATAVAEAPIPAEATKIFNERCYLCHGKGGSGDGFGGKGMKPPPRNFTDAAWQDSVSDEHIRTAILKGGGAVGKSPTMPPNPDLEGKTEVVDGLARMVRSFKGGPHASR